MARPFYLVDVFAERPYAGNQLAIVVSADDLSDETMQHIAAETNYSETTFVRPTPEPDEAYRVRIFTPAREIAFAGHPILGTGWVVRHYLAPGVADRLRLNLAVGEIPVTFESDASGGETVWFAAPPVSMGATCDRKQIATALGISADDVETQAPVQQFSASTSALIVPLRSLEALQRLAAEQQMR
jgi:trans-2,3-dihydro-3-hydroxyanthranilate isomerase